MNARLPAALAGILGACAMSADLSYVGPARDGGGACTPGATRGAEVCDRAGQWRGRCADGRPGVDEVCNLRDDDCDGTVDEGFVYEVIDASSAASLTIQGQAPTASPALLRTSDRIVALMSEGVGAENCSERVRGVFFDLEGRPLGATPLLQSIPAPETLFPRARGAEVILTYRGRDYVQPGCIPPIAERTCPIFTSRISAQAATRPLRYEAGACPSAAVVTRDSVIFSVPVGSPGGLLPARDYDLVAVGDDGRPLAATRGRLRTDETALKGAASERAHWFWGSGRALSHATSDLRGGDVRAEAALALSEEIQGVIDAYAVGGSVFVTGDRGLQTHVVEVGSDGAVVAQGSVDVPSGDALAPSPDGRQLYLCSTRFGVSFTRFDRRGVRLQRRVSLADGRPAGDCRSIELPTGVLLAWSTGELGALRWARVGCRQPP